VNERETVREWRLEGEFVVQLTFLGIEPSTPVIDVIYERDGTLALKELSPPTAYLLAQALIEAADASGGIGPTEGPPQD
jgi:hypothetical protein